jgi:hypothetical protein
MICVRRRNIIGPERVYASLLRAVQACRQMGVVWTVCTVLSSVGGGCKVVCDLGRNGHAGGKACRNLHLPYARGPDSQWILVPVETIRDYCA